MRAVRQAGLTSLALLCLTACRTAPAPEVQQDTDADDQLLGDVVDDNEAKLAKVASNDAAEAAGDAHFPGLSNESVAQFCARAEQRIAALDREHETLAARAGGNASTDEELGGARRALIEASADLEQVCTMSGPLFDDGRLGVSFAINHAQRQLIAARDGLSDARI